MIWQKWISTLFSLRGPGLARLEAIAQQVASRCQPLVWERVQGAIIPMSFHEARGYAHARAALVIRRQLEPALASHPWLSAEQRHALHQQTLDRVVTWAVGRAAQVRNSAPRSMRRAA
jgi:hypothetical protein